MMETIETWEAAVRGTPVRVTVSPDDDAHPDQYDCYGPADVAAWREGEWRFVTVTARLTLPGVDLRADLSGVEWGTIRNGSDVRHIGRDEAMAYPVTELVAELTEQAVALSQSLGEAIKGWTTP